ncbi:MAG: sel1 repeat family protein, partial [Polyangiaceae bacterium]|nr:sel1 repeat family protein [Polyangiaceae bacterium]
DEGFEGVAADPAKARELFELACKRGLGASCSRLKR